MQVPPVRLKTLLPVTVQTLCVKLLNITARLDVAVAETVPALPKIIVGAVPKVMVWLDFNGVTALVEPDSALLPFAFVA